MDMTGEYRLPAPPQAVWEALNDPEVLKACIPGCKELERTGEDGFSAVVAAKVGPVSATFKGTVKLADLDPPNGYTISGQGQGGAAGFAKGSARVSLAPEGEGTILRYEAKADVGGKLASIGNRLVQGVARKTADDFFGAFSARFAPPAEDGQAPAEPAAEAAAEAAPGADAEPPAEGEAAKPSWWRRFGKS